MGQEFDNARGDSIKAFWELPDEPFIDSETASFACGTSFEATAQTTKRMTVETKLKVLGEIVVENLDDGIGFANMEGLDSGAILDEILTDTLAAHIATIPAIAEREAQRIETFDNLDYPDIDE